MSTTSSSHSHRGGRSNAAVNLVAQCGEPALRRNTPDGT